MEDAARTHRPFGAFATASERTQYPKIQKKTHGNVEAENRSSGQNKESCGRTNRLWSRATQNSTPKDVARGWGPNTEGMQLMITHASITEKTNCRPKWYTGKIREWGRHPCISGAGGRSDSAKHPFHLGNMGGGEGGGSVVNFAIYCLIT